MSASVTWKPLQKKYAVTLKNNYADTFKSYDTPEDNIEFHDLMPFNKYTVQIAAGNSVGCSPMSHGLCFTTLEAGIMILIMYTCIK